MSELGMNSLKPKRDIRILTQTAVALFCACLCFRRQVVAAWEEQGNNRRIAALDGEGVVPDRMAAGLVGEMTGKPPVYVQPPPQGESLRRVCTVPFSLLSYAAGAEDVVCGLIVSLPRATPPPVKWYTSSWKCLKYNCCCNDASTPRPNAVFTPYPQQKS